MIGIAAHARSGVMVNREVVRLAPDDVEVARLHQRLHFGGERLGIVPVNLRLGKGTVPQRIELDRGDLILLAVARRLARMEIVDIADQEVGALRAHRIDPETMGEVHHMDRPERAQAHLSAVTDICTAVMPRQRVRPLAGPMTSSRRGIQ